MRKFNISKDYLTSLIMKYPFKSDICQILGINVTTLNRVLREYNLTMKRVNYKKIKPEGFKFRPDIDRDWLIENWVNTSSSLNELSLKENIPLSTLEYRVSKWQLKKPYKYQLQLNRLFNLEDPHLYYLAGLFATDGYFPFNVDAVEIDLTGDSEKKLLEDLRDYYIPDFPIPSYQRPGCSEHYKLRLSGPNVKNFFEGLLNTPTKNKTFYIKGINAFPSEDCAKAYIRGCFDGDGYISSSKFRVDICTASEIFVVGIRDTLNKYLGLHLNIHWERRKSGAYPSLSAAGSTARKLLTWVYSLEDCFKLERKYNKFIRMMIQSELQ